MTTTSNIVARRLASLLRAHGVTRVVVSPGSRNAPLIQAVDSQPGLSIELVTDERAAGFVAVGMAEISGRPVAMICTSGSAPLNYMPAVAEAYYSRLPLVVVSADRPARWIGQDDSQTLRQPGVMDNVVKKSYNIPSVRTEEDVWYAMRLINDALLTARSGAQGPVHINIEVEAPIGSLTDADEGAEDVTAIRLVRPQPWLSASDIKVLAEKLASTPRVLIVCGFMAPDKKINSSIGRMSRLENVAVMTETTANMHGTLLISNIDATLGVAQGGGRKGLEPQLVITCGGALVSRRLKQFLRSAGTMEHWHVSLVDDTVDCFKHLTTRIATSPTAFFSQLAATIEKMPARETGSEYSRMWRRERDRAVSLTQAYAARAGWSDFTAMATITDMIPRRWNVQYSNGTPIRYAQIFGYRELHRSNCNRGVSGIDGCTATAVGASLEYRHDATLLISGDTSAMYDLGALALRQISPRFKMVVIDNGGGGIFRFIEATSGMPVMERFLAKEQPVGALGDLARGMGFACYEADSQNALRDSFAAMMAETERPGLLIVHTPARESAEILKDYFKFCSTKGNE